MKVQQLHPERCALVVSNIFAMLRFLHTRPVLAPSPCSCFYCCNSGCLLHCHCEWFWHFSTPNTSVLRECVDEPLHISQSNGVHNSMMYITNQWMFIQYSEDLRSNAMTKITPYKWVFRNKQSSDRKWITQHMRKNKASSDQQIVPTKHKLVQKNGRQ